MIIEFLGVSGVGKTTIAKGFKKLFEDEGKTVVWDTYDLYEKHGWFGRNIIKCIRVVLYSIKNIQWLKEYKAYLLDQMNSKRDIRNRLFNGIYLKSLLTKAENDSCIHIFDEGSLQYLWSIKLRGKKPISQRDIDIVGNLFGIPNQVIVVYADAHLIAERIKNRGEYVRIMNEGDLIESINKMLGVQNTIKDLINKKTMVQTILNN